MKTIKSIFTFLMVSVISLVVLSCSKDEYESPLKGQAIADVTTEAGELRATVTLQNGDYSKCTVTSSESWCNPAIRSNYVEFDLRPNDSYDDRQAIITMTDPEDGTFMTFKLIQRQVDVLKIARSTYNVPEEGGSISINVESNLEYVVEIPSDCAWLTLASGTRGLSKSTVTLNVSKNETEQDRKATVKLTNTERGYSTEVIINQEYKQFFSIDPTEIVVPESGGEIEVNVETNVDYTISIPDSWIKVGEKKEVEKHKFVQKFNVAQYDGANTRVALVTFNVDTYKWSTSRTLTVTQSKALKINNTDVKVMMGETFDLTLVNNTGTPVTWSSSNTRVADVDSKGLVYGVNTGTAIITVKTTDGKYSDAIEVKVVDITGYLSYGWSVASFNGWGSIGCSLKNNSNYDIELTKCSIYRDGKLINSTTDRSLLGVLHPNESTGISINNVAITNGLTFVWDLIWNGKSYSYECVYKSLY